MEHVVFFPSPDGAPAFRRVPNFEEAVRLVEHLRNVDNVVAVAVHPLGAEVPLAFRAWYRVEVPGAVPGEVADQPEESAPVPAVVPAPADAVQAAAEGEPAAVAVPEQVAGDQVDGGQVDDEQPVPVLVEASASSNGHTPDNVKSLGFFA